MKKTGFLKKLWKNPFARLSIFSLGEAAPWVGIGPWQTIAVYDVWKQEKKAGKTPNIAEYLTIGIPVAIVDGIGAVLSLTGFGMPLAKTITIPCLILIWAWRFYKHTTGVKLTKTKTKTKIKIKLKK